MAWRETRASWLRLTFFFSCVAIGVAAIVMLRSIVQDVRTTLVREARELIGADVVVQGTRTLSPREQDTVSRSLAGIGGRQMEGIETGTMAEAPGSDGAVRLVELRAVEADFPYYG